MPADAQRQILEGSQQAGKTFQFSRQTAEEPTEWWFQHTPEGLVLFAVFFTLACRWNRCLGCNLPSKSSLDPISYQDLMLQIDRLFAEPEIARRFGEIRKVIVSNNGSMLDEVTFPSTALFYLLARVNVHLPMMSTLSMETRPEYVDWEELELLARVLRERPHPAALELSVGFEAFDDHIRNDLFHKGLSLATFERLVSMVGRHGYRLKCYFMLKPVPGLSDDEAVADIHRAIEFLDEMAGRHGVEVNMHLNPTYVAEGTELARAFHRGEYAPPRLSDVARAAGHGRGRRITIYLGLNDEGLAVPGASFIRAGEEDQVAQLERFNRTQDYALLDAVAGAAS